MRDRIPELFGGQIPKVLSDSEYVNALRAKLAEETSEYLAAVTPAERWAELADVLEVVLALAAQDELTPAELEELRVKKAAERGAFGARFWWQP